jgi:hypothetical protein
VHHDQAERVMQLLIDFFELLPIANGARESCAAARFMESSALWSSRDVRFDVATINDRQGAQRPRTGRTR